jgi:hypothetical protein
MADAFQGVSWVPLDVVANMLVEMRNSPEPMLHLAHPNPVPWNAVFTRIASTLNVGLVPYSDWLARLESKRLEFEAEATAKLRSGGNAKRPNAFNLLDVFYRPALIHSDPETEAFLPKVATDVARRVVPSFSSMRQLDDGDVDKWLTYWKSVGLIEF